MLDRDSPSWTRYAKEVRARMPFGWANAYAVLSVFHVVVRLMVRYEGNFYVFGRTTKLLGRCDENE